MMMMMADGFWAEHRDVLVEGLTLLSRLRTAGLDQGLAWVMPECMRMDGWPDVIKMYGLPVIYADVPRLTLGHELGRMVKSDERAADQV